MASKFGWIDFSNDERRQMLRIVDLFNQQDTRDELGVGTIRDAFANHFFPGTSTIQTRVRYFLFVPWIYQEVEQRMSRTRWSAERFSQEVACREKKLIRALEAGGEQEGVIGIEAKEKLQRLPSNIYWTGLHALKIRLVEGSQSQYERYISYYHRNSRSEASGMNSLSKEHDEPALEKNGSGWHPGIPKAPAKLLEVATLKLSRKEAAYLRDRILQSHGDSLMASLLLDADDTMDTSFLWQHPIIDSLPEKLQNSVLHARNFSETIHGAALLYNLMLSEAKESDDGIDKYSNWLDQWALELSKRWGGIKDWCQNRDAFWETLAIFQSQIPKKTRRFVDNWLSIISETGRPEKVSENRDAKMLISHRELQLKKKARARLHNFDALARWSGASGTAQLNYRWGIAKAHLTDIYTGLKGRKDTNA
ncbi:MAG: hypothetical protein KAU38_05675 [Desulfobacterales bacterium]|nr:hypothetical protein [Desulfobacterales bacterium]